MVLKANAISLVLILLGICNAALWGQTIINLTDCGVSYIDPQDANIGITSGRDTLVYQHFFDNQSELHAYYIDINAFGGQQIDRTKVFAIMPNDTLKQLGQLSFGNCLTCSDGFAFVFNDSLQVEDVNDLGTMELWLQSFNQPPFSLQGSLQTLRGVGRLSGLIPFCAKGLRVEYVVNSNPANATTEFSTHIICPEVIQDCTVEKDLVIDCIRDSFSLKALIPSKCFSQDVIINWEGPDGRLFEEEEIVLPLAENQGWYYLSIWDECCETRDSILVSYPQFADAGPDLTTCENDPIEVLGQGGVDYVWNLPSGDTIQGPLLTQTAVESGFFELIAYDTIGCAAVDSFYLEVVQPIEPIVQMPNICIGLPVQFVLNNDSLFSSKIWLNPNDQTIPNGNLSNFQLENTGIYKVVGTDQNGCTAELAFEVTTNPPTINWVTTSTCDTTTILIEPLDQLYIWESGDTTSNYQVTKGGTYSLTIEDSNGCQSTTAIEIPEPEGPSFNLEVIQPDCPGDFGKLEIFPANPEVPAIYSINGGENYGFETYFDDLVYGGYSILAQDEFGCIVQKDIEIIQPDTVGVSLDLEYLEVRPDAKIELKATTIGSVQKIQWLPKEIDNGQLSTSFLAYRDMDVRIIVEDANKCKAVDGFQLSVILSPIHRPNVFSPNNDGINDRFTFYSDQLSGEMIEWLGIYDRFGNLMFTATEIPLNQESYGWDGSHFGEPLNSGVYTYMGIVRYGNDIKRLFEGDVFLIR